jgi:hypothetical protein
MIRRINPLISLGLLTAVIHAILLFAVIPQVTTHITGFYNQDKFIDGYDQLADNLARGNGYRFYPDSAQTLMREPGYPVLLAGLMLLFGNSMVAVKLVNMCLALATAWLMTRIASRISGSRWLLILPPLLFLFHPATLIAESRGGVESLFTFLIMLFFVTLYQAMEDSTWWRYAITGAVLGVTVLVRSTPMLYPVFLFGYLITFYRSRIPFLTICRNIAIVIAMMSAMLSPWIIRNYRLTGRFIPTASVLGVSAQTGEYICTHLFESKPWVLLDHEAAQQRTQIATELGYRIEDPYYYQSFYSTQEELKFSDYLARQVFGRYKADPLFCARCMSLNVFNFWFAGKTQMSTMMNLAIQTPYLIFAILGVVQCVKHRKFLLVGPLVLFVLYVMAVHVPILAQARYSVPLIPILSILAAIALSRVFSSTASDRSTATLHNTDQLLSPNPAPVLAGAGIEK